jgi:proteasome activator-like protein
MNEPMRPQILTPGQPQGEDRADETQQVIAHPAKLLRIASMIREIVEEVRQVPLDEKGRDRLAEVYRSAVGELRGALSEDLQNELDTLAAPLEGSASESEIRVAQAQLLGWLEGLFHGIQAALWAQHAQAQAALEEMRRRQLPSGPRRERTGPDPRDPSGPPGQYL